MQKHRPNAHKYYTSASPLIANEILECEVSAMKKKARSRNRTVIFRPYITLRNGKRIYAKDYGKKAFRIEI